MSYSKQRNFRMFYMSYNHSIVYVTWERMDDNTLITGIHFEVLGPVPTLGLGVVGGGDGGVFI